MSKIENKDNLLFDSTLDCIENDLQKLKKNFKTVHSILKTNDKLNNQNKINMTENL